MPVAATGSIRQVGKDFDSGYQGEIIPNGATVILLRIAAHRDVNIFGKDADTFNPDRWIDASDIMKNNIMPFSMGNHNCVGESLAMAELESVLPYILSHFEIQLIEEGEPDFFLTLKLANAKLRLKACSN
jgi:cytochrome P450